MQELSNSITRPNLIIMGIEGEEVKANKTIIENFPNL
jgi:hypothetical protein